MLPKKPLKRESYAEKQNEKLFSYATDYDPYPAALEIVNVLAKHRTPLIAVDEVVKHVFKLSEVASVVCGTVTGDRI